MFPRENPPPQGLPVRRRPPPRRLDPVRPHPQPRRRPPPPQQQQQQKPAPNQNTQQDMAARMTTHIRQADRPLRGRGARTILGSKPFWPQPCTALRPTPLPTPRPTLLPTLRPLRAATREETQPHQADSPERPPVRAPLPVRRPRHSPRRAPAPSPLAVCAAPAKATWAIAVRRPMEETAPWDPVYRRPAWATRQMGQMGQTGQTRQAVPTRAPLPNPRSWPACPQPVRIPRHRSSGTHPRMERASLRTH